MEADESYARLIRDSEETDHGWFDWSDNYDPISTAGDWAREYLP